MPYDLTAALNFLYPPDRPVCVHLHLTEVTGKNMGSIIMRTPHTEAALRQMIRGHGSARWVSCAIKVVPTPDAREETFATAIAQTSSEVTPTTLTSLRNCPTAHVSVSGGTGVIPDTIVYPVNFADSGTSSLIHPIPTALNPPGFSLHISCPNKLESATVYADVYVTGVIEYVGAGAI